MIYIPAPKGDGGRIEVTESLWWSLVGPKPPLDRGYARFTDWDGCSCSPDRVWFLRWWDLRVACFCHDFAAHIGAIKRNTFGFAFYRNIHKVLRWQGAWWPLATFLALTYSTIVYPAYKLRGWFRE